MAITDIIPWRHQRRELAPRREEWRGSPVDYLQQQINRMFEDTFRFSPGALAGEEVGVFAPAVEITDNEREVRISAELPGIEAKDLDINVTEDAISIRGEKRQERQVEERGGQWTERSYGSFERVIPLPVDVKAENAKAQFKNGVLEVVLPKVEGAKPRVHKLKVE